MKNLRKYGSLYMANFANAKITVYFAFVFYLFTPFCISTRIFNMRVLALELEENTDNTLRNLPQIDFRLDESSRTETIRVKSS